MAYKEKEMLQLSSIGSEERVPDEGIKHANRSLKNHKNKYLQGESFYRPLKDMTNTHSCTMDENQTAINMFNTNKNRILQTNDNIWSDHRNIVRHN